MPRKLLFIKMTILRFSILVMLKRYADGKLMILRTLFWRFWMTVTLFLYLIHAGRSQKRE